MSQTSSIRIATWFVMVAAALNALSYFVRSGGWGNLFGTQHDNPVGIGFPFLIWHNGYMQSGPELSPVNLLLNVGLAILAGAIATWVNGWAENSQSIGNQRSDWALPSQ